MASKNSTTKEDNGTKAKTKGPLLSSGIGSIRPAGKYGKILNKYKKQTSSGISGSSDKSQISRSSSLKKEILTLTEGKVDGEIATSRPFTTSANNNDGQSERRSIKSARPGKYGEGWDDEDTGKPSNDEKSPTQPRPGAIAVKGIDYVSSRSLISHDASYAAESGPIVRISSSEHEIEANTKPPFDGGAKPTHLAEFTTTATLVKEPELVVAEKLQSQRQIQHDDEQQMSASTTFFSNKRVQLSLGLVCIITVAIAVTVSVILALRDDGDSGDNLASPTLSPAPTTSFAPSTSFPSELPSFIPTHSPSLAPTRLSWLALGSQVIAPNGAYKFGFSVSMSDDGSRMVVGAPHREGRVYVYEVRPIDDENDNGVAWTPLGDFITSGTSFGGSGSSVTMSGDGERVAVGTPNVDSILNDFTGRVAIYSYSSESQWVLLGEPIFGEGEYDSLGDDSASISLNSDGSRIALGSGDNDANSEDSNIGSVRVYQYDENNRIWIQLGEDIDGEGFGDRAGSSASLSGDGNCVAIGAFANDKSYAIEDSGHVRIYRYDDNEKSWKLLGQELNGREAGVRAGYSVSISQNCTRVAFGSEVTSGSDNDDGVVDVFNYDEADGEWLQVGESIQGQTSGERAGFSISLSREGSRIAVGAPYYERRQGYVKVYDFNGTAWEQLGESLTQDDADLTGFSTSMSRDGRRVMFGSPDDFSFDSNVSPHTGTVRVFELRDLK